jgi:hypothetical protein
MMEVIETGAIFGQLSEASDDLFVGLLSTSACS